MNALQRRQRRLALLGSCWLVSAIIHSAITLALTLALRPAGRGESSSSELIVSWSREDPAELELSTTLASSLEIGPDEPVQPLSALPEQMDATEHGAVAVEFNDEAGSGLARNPLAAPHWVPDQSVGSLNRRSEESTELASARAEFFGTVAYGPRLAYILDMSGSMDSAWDAEGQCRFDRARAELIRSVEQLRPEQTFCVVLFSDKSRSMFGHSYGLRFLPATTENRQRLKSWLLSISPGGGTNPNDALDRCRALRPSAIFLLSDGAFNINDAEVAKFAFGEQGGDRDEIVKRVDQQRIPIHTIAYEESGPAQNMQRLSEATGGEYRFVPSPPLAPDQHQRKRPSAVPLPAPEPVPPLPEQLAAKLLTLGKGHERLGHRREANAAFQRTVKQHPGTAAAKEAQERADELLALDKGN